MAIQSVGIPMPVLSELVPLNDAVKMVSKTKATILNARVKNPASVSGKGITWFIVGSIVMLSKASLIAESLRRGWIKEL